MSDERVSIVYKHSPQTLKFITQTVEL